MKKTVSVEAPHETKGSLERSEKAVQELMKRESGDLLKRCLFRRPCKYGELAVFLRRKSAAAIYYGVVAAF